MASDDDRRELFDLLEAGLGSRGAALLMSHLPPVGWADLATKSDLAALRSELLGETGELRGEMGELRGKVGELRGEMGELRGEMGELRGKVGELRGEMAELRAELGGEIGALRIEVHDRMSGLVPRLWAANVATMIGLSGLVFAVASFAR
jgi:hypothetical protein